MNFILEVVRTINVGKTQITTLCEGCLEKINSGEMCRRLEHSVHYSHNNDECFNKMIENVDRRV